MANFDGFDDHPSLSASLEDFEHNDRSPTFALPSQHSGFKSDESEADPDSTSEGPWSPPAWRRQSAAAGWYRHQPYLHDNLGRRPSASPSHSKETSPQYESAKEEDEDLTVPANIPLPRGSMSPVKEASPSPGLFAEGGPYFGKTFGEREQSEQAVTAPDNNNNCTCL